YTTLFRSVRTRSRTPRNLQVKGPLLAAHDPQRAPSWTDEIRLELGERAKGRARQRERAFARRELAVRDGDDGHSRGRRREQAVRRVLDRRARRGREVEASRCLEVDVGSGLAARHLLGGDGGGEQRPKA